MFPLIDDSLSTGADAQSDDKNEAEFDDENEAEIGAGEDEERTQRNVEIEKWLEDVKEHGSHPLDILVNNETAETETCKLQTTSIDSIWSKYFSLKFLLEFSSLKCKEINCHHHGPQPILTKSAL